jgi:hypothetical protein
MKMHAQYCIKTSQSSILGILRMEKSIGRKGRDNISSKLEESFKLILLRENIIIFESS